MQLGRPLGFDLHTIFDKLVLSGVRGGWCYEMNTLFAWVLEQIGFSVTRLACGVGRELAAHGPIGDHMALCVDLERPYLVDVGFGDGLLEPVPIIAGPLQQEFLEFRLEDLGLGWWRFHNHPRGGAASFHFECRPAAPEVLAERCRWLQTAPESGFVSNAVCQKFAGGKLFVLRGAVLKIIGERDVEQTVLNSAAEYRSALHSRFGIEVPDVAALWEKVSARHAQWQAARAARDTPAA